MDNRPIGVFDSGLGGLTVVKELNRRLPEEQIIYFGDTGRVPYGTRSDLTIKKYAAQDVRFLAEFGIKMIIAACGTVSAVALEELRVSLELPIVGVLAPSIPAAAVSSASKRIGVLGTAGTIKSGEYERRLREFDHEIEVTSVACPLFVPLVENGYLKHEATYTIAREYLEKLGNVDTIILGCTHYPLLREVISDIIGGDTVLIDPGAEAARYTARLLKERNMQGERQEDDRYFVSDSVDNFARIGGMFLEREITADLQRVDIEKY